MDTVNLPPQNMPPVDPNQPQVAPPPGMPVSGGNKEQGPIGSMRTEYVAPAPAETVPQIPQELAELGIETSPDTDKPEVPPAAQQVGVQPVKTAIPVQTESQGTVVINQAVPTPLTYQQAVTTLKAHKADESISWLSMLSKYILEKLGMVDASQKG